MSIDAVLLLFSYKNCRIVAAITLLMIVSACSSVPNKPSTVSANEHYCGNYLMYRMCADDLNHDGEADILYFEDTKEVFMINPSTPQSVIGTQIMHECVQIMDEEMVNASSALHKIDESMGALQRGKYKARLMLSYTRYMSDINKCRQSIGEYAMPSGNEDFGDEDFDEL